MIDKKARNPSMQHPSNLQPFSIKLINRFGRTLRAFGISVPSLSPQLLLFKAQKQIGLHDFGDEGFLPALYKLCQSLDQEAKLSQIGRIAAQEMLINNLKIRLQLTDYRKRRPEVAQQKIQRPLFVLGLPRTGTTILYELLAQDPAHRSPVSWEVSQPMPPAHPDTFLSDPRIAAVEDILQKTEILAPGFKAIHEIGSQLPQECVAILASHFISDQYGATFFIPKYREWTRNQDMTKAYAWHYQFLQHLQVDYKKQRWVLKTPPHLAYIDAIVRQYPDAAIIQTHRDPMDVMGSISSLSCTLHSAFSDDIDPKEIAANEVLFFSALLKQGMAQRDAMPDRDSRFFDVQFSDIISDPIASIDKIYRHFGFYFSAEARQAMQQYLENRPRDKHGTHHYTLEDFGLSRREHKPRFQEYNHRYGF